MTKLLIADDEEDMRLLLRVMIRVANEGLEIIDEAHDGREAVDRAFSGDGDHDVIVLDNRMPELTGLEAAIEILERRPDQPALLASTTECATRRSAPASAPVCTRTEMLPDVLRSLTAA